MGHPGAAVRVGSPCALDKQEQLRSPGRQRGCAAASPWLLQVVWDAASRAEFPIRWWLRSVVLLHFLRLILSFGKHSWAGPICSSGKLWASLRLWAQWPPMTRSLPAAVTSAVRCRFCWLSPWLPFGFANCKVRLRLCG